MQNILSSRYQINRLWNGIAPILTTNLIESGVVEAAANDSLTQAAVNAFDRYTNSTSRPAAAVPTLDASPTKTLRRRRHQSAKVNHSAADFITEPSRVTTPNDNFFEYQRRMGYTLDNQRSDDSLPLHLKETHIINAIIFYLQHFHILDEAQNHNANNLQQQHWAKSIVHELQSDSPAFTIDLWAAVQRGEGSHHKFHVHEGAVVSGVYYSNCPLDCAPLVLRKPLLDGINSIDYLQHDIRADKESERDDEVIHPENGQLVLFPPWLRHGVPLAKEQHCKELSEAPRVSWAFNLNVRLASIGDAWGVTLPPNR